MADFQTLKILVDDYTILFKVKLCHVGKITTQPMYNKIRTITNELEANFACIEDKRDATYGKLHLIVDVQHMDSGHAVTPSTDWGEPTQDPNDTWEDHQSHI